MPKTGLGRVSRFALVGVIITLVVTIGILAAEIGTGRPKTLPRIQIDSLSLDRVDAPVGNSFYVLELNASNEGQAAWDFNPAYLKMIGNYSHVYTTDSDYNATSLLGVFSVGQRSYKVGRVAFELPVVEAPSQIQYNDPGAGINLDIGNIPQVSAIASRFNFNLHLNINGLSVNGWTVTECPTPNPWVCSIIANGVIENVSLVFFSGQTVQVNLWFEYLRHPVDPTTITLESVSADNDFQIVSIRQSVPFTMTGWGAQSGLVLLLRVPAGQHSGALSMSVRFSD